MSGRPRLFVVSGPSGTGKGTLIGKVREARPELGLTVSATTRPPRPGEADGVAYHFMDDEEFQRRVDAGEFVEWAWVSKHRYGTLCSEVDKCLARNASVVLEIDVQGALNVRNIYPDAVLVFIEPPSLEVLEQRLRGRGTEDESSIELRLANARHEMDLAKDYDARVVNDDLATAVRDLANVLESYEMDGGNS